MWHSFVQGWTGVSCNDIVADESTATPFLSSPGPSDPVVTPTSPVHSELNASSDSKEPAPSLTRIVTMAKSNSVQGLPIALSSQLLKITPLLSSPEEPCDPLSIRYNCHALIIVCF